MNDARPLRKTILGRKTALRRRTVFATLAAIVVFAGLLLLFGNLDARLHPSSWVSGYVLMGCLLFLAGFNLRKKLPALPTIGSGRFWMQAHIYVALVSIGIFLSHIGPGIPMGGLSVCWRRCL